MLRFLSKVRIEFNALDPRITPCMEFLAQCHARKSKDSNPNCQIQVHRRTDDFPPQISVTFVDGAEETFDVTSVAADHIRNSILEKARVIEMEQMFREAGVKWPVDIPEEELNQPINEIKAWFTGFVCGSYFANKVVNQLEIYGVTLALHRNQSILKGRAAHPGSLLVWPFADLLISLYLAANAPHFCGRPPAKESRS